jgi:hypothetical protein
LSVRVAVVVKGGMTLATNDEEFERLDTAMRKILSLPHSEIVRREDEYKRQSALNPKRRGPKPRAYKKRKRGVQDAGPQ